jgi:hypothetical protein
MPHTVRLLPLTVAALLASCASADSRPTAVVDTRVHKANFTLTSAEKLFSGVFGSRLSKSEFETEAQYRARIEHMRPSGTYFIMVAPNFIRYIYAAEIQRLVVMARQTGSNITVAYSSRDLGKVPMQNAFGATVDTTLIKSRSLELEVQNPPMSFPKGVVWKDKSDLGIYGMEDIGLGLPVTIAPAEAERVVKNKSFALVIGFRVGDLAGARHEKGGVAPTFDAPIGIAGDTSKLPVHIFYLGVVDRTTENVVASWTNPKA